MRKFFEGRNDCLHDERQECDLYSFLFSKLLGVLAKAYKLSYIHLVNIGEVGRRVFRQHHLLGNGLAQTSQRYAFLEFTFVRRTGAYDHSLCVLGHGFSRDVFQEIIEEDAAPGASRFHTCEAHTQFGCFLAHGWRGTYPGIRACHELLATSGCGPCTRARAWSGGSSALGAAWFGHQGSGNRSCLAWGGFGWLFRGGALSRIVVGENGHAWFYSGAFFDEELFHHPRLVGRNFDRGFIRHDLAKRLIGLKGVAFFDFPLDEFAFENTLAEFGKFHFSHGLLL